MFTFIISDETQTNMQMHEHKLQNPKYAEQLAKEKIKFPGKQLQYKREIKYRPAGNMIRNNTSFETFS